jgi:hypothetical protein
VTEFAAAYVPPGRVERDRTDRHEQIDIAHRLRDDERGSLLERERVCVLLPFCVEAELVAAEEVVAARDPVQRLLGPLGPVAQLGADAEARDLTD